MRNKVFAIFVMAVLAFAAFVLTGFQSSGSSASALLQRAYAAALIDDEKSLNQSEKRADTSSALILDFNQTTSKTDVVTNGTPFSLAPTDTVTSSLSAAVASTSFASTRNLSNDGRNVHSSSVQMSVSINRVYVAWSASSDQEGTDGEVYLRVSTDGGQSFGSKKNLSNNGLDSGYPKIYASGSTVYVLWEDHDRSSATGTHGLYFKKSTDSGATFGSKKTVQSGVGIASYDYDWIGTNKQIKSPANDLNSIYVVWKDYGNDAEEIIFKRSIDGGSSFADRRNLSNNAGRSVTPDMVASGNMVYVVWTDMTTGNGDPYLRASSNNGATFGGTKNLSAGSSSAQTTQPKIALGPSNTVYVVWRDIPVGSGTEWTIRFKKSTDAAATFSSALNFGVDGVPIIAVTGNNVFVAYSNSFDVYIKRSVDAGSTFSAPKNVSNSPSTRSYAPVMSISPNLAVSGGVNVFISWYEDEKEIYYSASTDKASTFSTPQNLSNNADGHSVNPVIGSYLFTVHVAWQDSNLGEYQTYYKTGALQ